MHHIYNQKNRFINIIITMSNTKYKYLEFIIKTNLQLNLIYTNISFLTVKQEF